MSDTLTITAETLNVRAGAGKDHPVVAKLPKGTPVQRLDQADGWFRIQTSNGIVGWISANYAAAVDASPADPAASTASSTSAAPAPPAQSPASTASAKATAPAGTKLRVTATTLNLRAGPGKEQPLVKQLPNGMIVDPLEVSGDGEWTRVRSPGGFEGWVSSKYVAKDDGTDPHAAADGDPKWYAIAYAERGQRETDGPGDNPRILEYQKACSYNAHDEDVPWCSSFANWVMQQAGIKGSGEASARSWLSWGQKLETPRRGCIVVLKRPGSPTNGHVTFYVGEENGRLKLLGGNQENQVKISLYDKSRLLGYRWPKNA